MHLFCICINCKCGWQKPKDPNLSLMADDTITRGVIRAWDLPHICGITIPQKNLYHPTFNTNTNQLDVLAHCYKFSFSTWLYQQSNLFYLSVSSIIQSLPASLRKYVKKSSFGLRNRHYLTGQYLNCFTHQRKYGYKNLDNATANHL